MNQHVTLGLDLGTTSVKAVAFGEDAVPLGTHAQPTTWYADRAGGSCLDLRALYEAVNSVLVAVTDGLASQGMRATGVGITGMAETGVLLDGGHQPLWPAIAWHDGRGREQLDRVAAKHPEVMAQFGHRTGLPWDQQASFAKIAWLVENHPTTAGRLWLSIPELVAYLLTGTAAAERSLASRTGLIDHTTERPWLEAFDAIGLDPAVMPQLQAAQMGWGQLLPNPLEPALSASANALASATVTVAGHDHVVAAQGAGVNAAGQVFNSCGTADVVLRIVDTWPSRSAFEPLGAMNVSMGFHTRPGQFVVNGGTKAGYVLRRITELVGPVPAPEARAPERDSGVRVEVPAFGDDELVIRARGEVTPADVWEAALEAVCARSRQSTAAVERAFGPYTDVICGGGWTRVPAVRRMKEQTYHDVSFADVDEPGCLGAAQAAREVQVHQVRNGLVDHPRIVHSQSGE